MHPSPRLVRSFSPGSQPSNHNSSAEPNTRTHMFPAHAAKASLPRGSLNAAKAQHRDVVCRTPWAQHTPSAPFPHHVTHSQHRQPIALHVTSTTILAPPSCSSSNSRFARRLCGIPQYRTLSVSDRVAMSRCVPAGRFACPPVVSPVFSSFGSLASCFGRVWSGLSRRVPRCARRGPVSSLAVVPCRGALILECPRVGGPALV